MTRRSMNVRHSLIWNFVLALTWATMLFAGTAGARELPEFTHLVEQYGPAVVNVSTKQAASPHESSGAPPGFEIPQLPEGSPWEDLFRRFFDGPRGPSPGPEGFEGRSLGSGLIVESDGYIITNNHVIEGADEIIVRLNDRRELTAEVVGTDKRSDIALLKVDASDLPVVKLGSSRDLKVGEWVMAIGSPFGFDHSVSVGVVSALGRSLPSENYVPFIQTDVAINPGNSGGPLFNLDGEVVGINSQIYSRTGGFMGLSFAIPVDVAMEVVQQLKDKGHVSRGWLGVLIQDVNRDLAESFGMNKPRGALVAKVLEDSPAAEAGLQVGDVIVEFNGKPVTYSSDLPPLVGRAAVDEQARVKIIRDGDTRTLDVAIGQLPEEEKLASMGKPHSGSENRIGVTVSELTPEQRGNLELQHDVGVVVTGVEPGPAREAGIRRGDVIVRINNIDIGSPNRLREVIADLPEGSSVPVLVQRRSGPLFLALRLPGD